MIKIIHNNFIKVWTTIILIIDREYVLNFFILVSLVCFLTIGFLMMSNLFEYLDNTPTEELFVDTSRNKKLQINFDIIVPKVSCDCMYILFLFIEKYLLIL